MQSSQCRTGRWFSTKLPRSASNRPARSWVEFLLGSSWSQWNLTEASSSLLGYWGSSAVGFTLWFRVQGIGFRVYGLGSRV